MRYRLLFFDRRHHLVSRFEFQAPNDAEAQAAARELTDTPRKELWCGQRIIGVWNAPLAANSG